MEKNTNIKLQVQQIPKKMNRETHTEMHNQAVKGPNENLECNKRRNSSHTRDL